MECSKQIFDMIVRIRFMKVYVWNIALYGYEAWTIRKNEKGKILKYLKYDTIKEYRRLHRLIKRGNSEIPNRIELVGRNEK